MSGNNPSWEAHPATKLLIYRAQEINFDGGIPCPTCWLPCNVVVVEFDTMLHSDCFRGHDNTLAPTVLSHLIEVRKQAETKIRNFGGKQDLAS